MKLELTEIKNERGGLEFQFSKFIFESSSLYKKCQSLRFPSGIHIYLIFKYIFNFFSIFYLNNLKL
jgi:hypothetical protein